jgi:hypothetical protein
MYKILEEYLNLLWRLFQYDINVFSQVWIYAWLLIPAIFYFIFFMMKWAVLTAPFWIPINMVLGGFKSLFKTIFRKK